VCVVRRTARGRVRVRVPLQVAPAAARGPSGGPRDRAPGAAAVGATPRSSCSRRRIDVSRHVKRQWSVVTTARAHVHAMRCPLVPARSDVYPMSRVPGLPSSSIRFRSQPGAGAPPAPRRPLPHPIRIASPRRFGYGLRGFDRPLRGLLLLLLLLPLLVLRVCVLSR
jgi:hypothetical protein